LIPKIEKRFTTYGLTSQADYQAKDVSFEGLKSRYRVSYHGDPLGWVDLNLPGLHNVYNSMASIVVGLELGVPLKTILEALREMEGVQRRLEVQGSTQGITVVDDYGHHPTEIKATLQAARQCWPDRRLVVVFQPHRYTRTAALFDDFTRAFYQADSLVVLPIYSAGEAPMNGISGETLYEGVRLHGHKDVVFQAGHEPALSYLKDVLKQGDILLTLGAGDVWQVGKKVLED
jgi:UDP-N-acetylmuramate--alanine ligase